MADYDHITKTQQQLLLDDLKSFTEDDWASVTVCDPWTPRQLVAHLTSMNNQTRGNFLVGALRHRFDIDAFLGEDLKRFDVGSNEDILNAFEQSVTNWKRPPLPKIVPPTESMIHADDIRQATGRPRNVDPEHVVPLLPVYRKIGPPVRGKERSRGLRFQATDANWAEGEGPEVAGPAFDLLLALGGRGAALENCEGDGVETMRSRCA